MFLIITCPLLIIDYREHVLLYMISKKIYKICLQIAKYVYTNTKRDIDTKYNTIETLF
jgi:hypothetical protein